jgi:hypothetical protein
MALLPDKRGWRVYAFRQAAYTSDEAPVKLDDDLLAIELAGHGLFNEPDNVFQEAVEGGPSHSKPHAWRRRQRLSLEGPMSDDALRDEMRRRIRAHFDNRIAETRAEMTVAKGARLEQLCEQMKSLQPITGHFGRAAKRRAMQAGFRAPACGQVLH